MTATTDRSTADRNVTDSDTDAPSVTVVEETVRVSLLGSDEVRITVEGTGICHRNQLCAGLQSCTSSADCPPNYGCSISTCCGPEQGNICIRPCHEEGFAPASIEEGGDGRTTAGG